MVHEGELWSGPKTAETLNPPRVHEGEPRYISCHPSTQKERPNMDSPPKRRKHMTPESVELDNAVPELT